MTVHSFVDQLVEALLFPFVALYLLVVDVLLSVEAWLLIAVLAILAGCAAPEVRWQTVTLQVPIPVPCVAPFRKGGKKGYPPFLKEVKGGLLISENPIGETIKLLKQGKILAIKGLGGFHLACDATNEEAVNRLRMKKRKSNKPFALMSPDVETIKKFCKVSEAEEACLISIRRPIVSQKVTERTS